MSLFPEKPFTDFFKLEKCLCQYGKRFELDSRKMMSLCIDRNDGDVVVILSGTVLLYRGDDILAGIEQAPYIWGLPDGVVKRSVEIKLMVRDYCSGYYLSSVQAISAIESRHCWRHAFSWLAWQSRVLELRNLHLIGHNAYSQSRAMLMSMAEWDEDLRSRTGVMNYIHQSTGISRSVIAEILASLRKGGYIEMKSGKLVGIKQLPLKY
ncbi:helix-turn-helix domain-containing protein [Citrobacter arsenatis]|uniref:helix-turn-helix domain-containing protein n=1 Tax=Citrobacter arsenatis TaxID=2546350 RepID=UPI00300E639E